MNQVRRRYLISLVCTNTTMIKSYHIILAAHWNTAVYDFCIPAHDDQCLLRFLCDHSNSNHQHSRDLLHSPYIFNSSLPHPCDGEKVAAHGFHGRRYFMGMVCDSNNGHRCGNERSLVFVSSRPRRTHDHSRKISSIKNSTQSKSLVKCISRVFDEASKGVRCLSARTAVSDFIERNDRQGIVKCCESQEFFSIHIVY